MVYTVYILSNSDGRYYIGYTSNVANRLRKHNKGDTKSTRGKGEWKIVYTENFKIKSEAIRRENYIKSQKSKKFIEKLIHSGVEK